MADKQCTECGEVNPEDSNFCSNCGGREFKEVPPGLARRLEIHSEVEARDDVRLGIGRVVVLSLLSFGLYQVWWFYITWKHLDSETSEEHHPVWHALTLFVPIYNLFRMHHHVSVVRNLATGAGVATSLSVGLIVILFAVSNVLDGISLRIDDRGTLIVLGVLSTVLTTTVLYLPQEILNEYWRSVRGANLREARLGVGEVILVLLGVLFWVILLIPA